MNTFSEDISRGAASAADNSRSHALSFSTAQKLHALQEFIGCIFSLSFTRYSGTTFELLSSTAQNSDILSTFLAMDSVFSNKKISDPRELLASSGTLSGTDILNRLNVKSFHEIRIPLICTNRLGMMWISDIEWTGAEEPVIHVMGPAFVDDFPIAKIEARLDHLHLSLPLKRHFLDTVKELPIIPTQTLLQYAVMLHYCITGEHILMNQLFSSVPDYVSEENKSSIPKSSRSGDYILEQQLLTCVREGNLSYQSAMERLSSFNQEGKLDDSDHLRHVKNMQISFTTLCTRAAIEGGLSPDSAYLLSDHYICKIEAANSSIVLGAIGQSMLEDFIKKVHRVKTDHISPPIQQICSQIQLHPEMKYHIHSLAEKLGYSDYYLTKKFKQETGSSISEYITAQKMEKAKQLLTGTTLTIGQVAETLHICSQSYFGNLFQKHTGMSPLEYKNRSGS